MAADSDGMECRIERTAAITMARSAIHWPCLRSNMPILGRIVDW